jgi:NADP-dependent 3-hydroxy acid dehydrogenase YdfG
MKNTILITGASSGIGKATAILFQQRGWNVVATMRSPEKETELTELENVLVTKLDVLDLNTIKNAVATGLEAFGQIDALVNNAGYGAYGPLEVFSRESIVRQFNTNVIGLLDVTREIIPHFRQRRSGSIINISSIGGQMAFPLGTLYHGSKFAVEGISEALSFEMAQVNVKVKIIEPGMIATDFGSRSFDFQNDESISEYQPIVGALFAGFQQSQASLSPASLVAEVIYQAATDQTDQLRYRAGDDAEHSLNNRKRMSDNEFGEMITKQYSL